MKYLKQLFLATTLMCTALSASAASIIQDVFIDPSSLFVEDVSGDTAFNIDTSMLEVDQATGGIFLGTIQYKPEFMQFGITSQFDDPYFNFSFSLGDFAITNMDDEDYNPADPFATGALGFADFGPFAGLNAMETNVDNGAVLGSIVDTSLLFFDALGLAFEAEIFFANTSIPEPSVLALFALGLLAMGRRKAFQK